MIKIPDYKKILQDSEAFKVSAFRIPKGARRVWVEKEELAQETIPKDDKLLLKIGIQPDSKVLVIAGYYGEWANAFARAGCKVDYSELSPEIVNFAKKKYGQNKNIKKWLAKNYVEVPENSEEYDWTISFEPTGSKMGLPISVVRSLINKIGVTIIHYPRESVPAERYEWMKIISDIYDCNFERRKIMIKGLTHHQKPINQNHIITTLKTNQESRKMVREDISCLENGIISAASVKRLEKIGSLLDQKYLMEI